MDDVMFNVASDALHIRPYSDNKVRYRSDWTDPTTVDTSCLHDEACSNASGLTPPRWL
ncbi:hypothetical protein GOY19_12155 [Aeromonas hydrophila]|nr:hypothetical protein [Aeromonas hydrophila]MBW3815117.1 hypothetical protein [Aeromonas hydrophila]